MNTRELFDLQGRVAIVTGGSIGLGRDMADALADMGASWCCARARKSAASRRRTTRVAGRARDRAGLQRGRPAGRARAGGGGRLGLRPRRRAGQQRGHRLGQLHGGDAARGLNKVLETNLTGTFLCAQAAGRVMIDQGRGSIVNIASVSGMGGAPPDVLQAAGYHASKGGVIAFTRDLACEWARHGIRVNAIAPGWFPTHMSKRLGGGNADRLRAGIPLARFGTQDDLKGAVAFLASDASAYVTGHVLVVDGGQSAW